MDREFQHSTMGLKEEKQHLLNIKQLRQRREQLSSSMGPKSEIDMVFGQKDQTEERFKVYISCKCDFLVIILLYLMYSDFSLVVCRL